MFNRVLNTLVCYHRSFKGWFVLFFQNGNYFCKDRRNDEMYQWLTGFIVSVMSGFFVSSGDPQQFFSYKSIYSSFQETLLHRKCFKFCKIFTVILQNIHSAKYLLCGIYIKNCNCFSFHCRTRNIFDALRHGYDWSKNEHLLKSFCTNIAVKKMKFSI